MLRSCDGARSIRRRAGIEAVMREQLVAWAEDCQVRGEVDLGEGRLSDQVNELEVVTFFGATLAALDDGRELEIDEVEVERRELHVIEVHGRQGDPERRLRTFKDPVMLQVGPYTVRGSLHRAPVSQPLAALASWNRFIPVTDVTMDVDRPGHEPIQRDVVLVNRDRIIRHEALDSIGVMTTAAWPPLPKAEPEQDVEGG
jgi:hypothetical protein